MSNELIPLSYGRDAYNIPHHTELQTHTDALTAEQARQIHDNFDIEVYVGKHGARPGKDDSTLNDRLYYPTQQEYDQVAAVIESIEPGDALFLESYGFDRQPISNPSDINSFMVDGVFVKKKDLAGSLEQARKNYKIDAWDYAEGLAVAKGIRTVYADQDAFDAQNFQQLHGGKDYMEMVNSPFQHHGDKAALMYAPRERAARNIIKDYALEHLPPEGTPNSEARKPKLVMLFGGDHRIGLERGFEDIGLEANVHAMNMSSHEERVVEQVSHVMRENMIALKSMMLQMPKNSWLVDEPPTTDEAQPTVETQSAKTNETPGSNDATIHYLSARRHVGRAGLRGF